MATRMVQRNTVVDAFVRVGDPKTDEALQAARQTVGEDAWKSGYSLERFSQARSVLRKHGVEPIPTLAGRLLDVCPAQTEHNGNKFDKLRVVLDSGSGSTILTSDMQSEFSQRLLAKLDAATQGGHRDVTIGGFAEEVKRDGKTFVNHVATLKGADGQEIKAVPGHFAKAAERAQDSADLLRAAGLATPQILQSAQIAARTEHFTALAEKIHDRLMLDQKKVPAIEQLGQVTGRFVSATDQQNGRVHVEVSRLDAVVYVDIPKQALPDDLKAGAPIKLHYDRSKGVTADVGKGKPGIGGHGD